jgi:hypothetical protein
VYCDSFELITLLGLIIISADVVFRLLSLATEVETLAPCSKLAVFGEAAPIAAI